MKTAKDIEKLSAKAVRLCHSEDEFTEYEGYSGRGMYGSKSPFAFSSNIYPKSVVGEKFQKLGFFWDNLGVDFIYYLR